MTLNVKRSKGKKSEKIECSFVQKSSKQESTASLSVMVLWSIDLYLYVFVHYRQWMYVDHKYRIILLWLDIWLRMFILYCFSWMTLEPALPPSWNGPVYPCILLNILTTYEYTCIGIYCVCYIMMYLQYWRIWKTNCNLTVLCQ